MKPDPTNTPEVAGRSPALAQAVAAPLTRAAIFPVATLNPGSENRATLRSLCGDLAALVRAVEFRDLEGGLSCVIGFGSDAWDRLFGQPRPAELHPFREIRAGARHAVSTPGDLLFHIRAKRMDLSFELATQIMARIGNAVSPGMLRFESKMQKFAGTSRESVGEADLLTSFDSGQTRLWEV